MQISRIIYILICRVTMAVLRVCQEPLPLKVAPIQPSVTAAFHLQSRRDSDCQMWELTARISDHMTLQMYWKPHIFGSKK